MRPSIPKLGISRLVRWLLLADLREMYKTQGANEGVAEQVSHDGEQRLVIVVLTGITLVWLGGLGRASLDGRDDLLRDATWRTSSSFNYHLPPHMFFHTGQDSGPWVQYDLGHESVVSSVVVENSDLYPERAIPLVLESSDDGVNFDQLARRDSVFASWTAEFAPKKLRYLRVKAARTTWLHLKSVRAYGHVKH